MFFLNLSAAEFFGLLGVLGGAVTALYFLDRSKRRTIVSTLQFWVAAAGATEQRSRKKVNQPWSLLLQLLSLLLLLLAIAQVQWGTKAAAGRDHVLLIDTSAWSSARLQTNRTVLTREAELAKQYVGTLPRQDRLLIAGVDALAAPLSGFSSDREKLAASIDGILPNYSALDLTRAFEFARHAQTGSGGLPGEIVYIGPQRIPKTSTVSSVPQNLRVIPVAIPARNVGIRTMNVKRAENEANGWQAQIALKNYAGAPQRVTLRTQFAGTHFTDRSYVLQPHGGLEAEYRFMTNTGGKLLTEVEAAGAGSQDVLAADDSVAFQLPSASQFRAVVYTRRPAVIRPVLEANHRITASFSDPARSGESVSADLLIFDGFTPARVPSLPSIWIDPTSPGLPFETKAVVSKTSIKTWNSEISTSTGLHALEQQITQAKIFNTQPNDVALAGTKEGTVIVLRPAANGHGKFAVIGFDPLETHLRFTVTMPLLFASLFQWMEPDSSRTTEWKAAEVGAAQVALEPGDAPKSWQATTSSGTVLPFTEREQSLQFYVNRPETIRVTSGTREEVLSLTLPEVADAFWTRPQSARTGLPGFAAFSRASVDLWKWLAALGASGLILEWFLFGPSAIKMKGRLLGSNRNRSTVDRQFVTR